MQGWPVWSQFLLMFVIKTYPMEHPSITTSRTVVMAVSQGASLGRTNGFCSTGGFIGWKRWFISL